MTRSAVILAAGRGSRLGARTRLRPKCLVRLAGRRALDWQMDALREVGIDDITLVGGYRADALRDVAGVELRSNAAWSQSGPVASLLCAQPKRFAQGLLVVYGDCLFHPTVLAALCANSADIAITADVQWQDLWTARFTDVYADAETFRHRDGRLLEIGRRASAGDDVQAQFTGLLKFSAAGWRSVEKVLATLDDTQTRALDMTALLARLLRDKVAIATVPIAGRWCEIDSEHDLRVYRSRLRRRAWSHDWRSGLRA